MKCFAKYGFCFSAGIILFMALGTLCTAAASEENGFSVSSLLSGGKATIVKIMVNAAGGRPKTHTLRLAYPVATLLAADLSLSVKKGSCKIELLENGSPAVVLDAREKKTVQGNGRIRVNEDGAVQYRMTAKQAKDVAFDIVFIPVMDELRVSRAYLEERFSAEGAGLNLRLECAAGNSCLIQVQNVSKTKVYRNILFRIDYKVMVQGDIQERSKYGTVGAVLLPAQKGEWPLGLVFGEPPQELKLALIKVDAADLGGMAAPAAERRCEMFISLRSAEK